MIENRNRSVYDEPNPMETSNYSQIPSGTFEAPHLANGKTVSSHVTVDRSAGNFHLYTLIGYLCLALGFIIIVADVFQTYRVFTKQDKPPQLFDFEGVKLDLAKLTPSLPMSDSVKKIMKDNNVNITQLSSGPSEPTEILPPAMINDVSNFGIFMFLVGFGLNLGYKVASIGVKLIRPIYIKA